MENSPSGSAPGLVPQPHTADVTLTHPWGIFGIGDVPVQLSWSPEHRTLSIRRASDNSVLLSTEFSNITRADFAFNLLTLSANGKKFRLAFGPQAHLFMADGQLHTDGGLTMLLGSLEAKGAGMDGLRRELQLSGTRTTKPHLLKLILWTTVCCLVVIALAIVCLGIWASHYTGH